MKNNLRLAPMLLSGVLAFSGCMEHVKIQRLEIPPEKLAQIKTITVIRPPVFDEVAVSIRDYGDTVALLFGLVGALIATATTRHKQKKLSKALQNKESIISSTLANTITDKLSQLGYQANVEDGPWEKTSKGFKLNYDKIQSNADAILVVFPTFAGFMADSSDTDYLPTILTVAILLGKDNTQSVWPRVYRGWPLVPLRLHSPAWCISLYYIGIQDSGCFQEGRETTFA